MTRPLLLDLFCGAGGATAGYYRAGFDVVGIDVRLYRRYPYRQVVADVRDLSAADLLAYGPVAVVASPPCKVHTSLKAFARADHVDLVPHTRKLLQATGLPYVIENVPGAPLVDPVVLCGSMFGLGVRRHRLFELGPGRVGPPQPACNHAGQTARSPGYTVNRYNTGRKVATTRPTIHVTGGGHGTPLSGMRVAMGIDWMSRRELVEAVPPVYAAYIGWALMAAVGSVADPQPLPTER